MRGAKAPIPMIAAGERRIQGLLVAFNKERCISKTSRGTKVEVLRFPGANSSAAHLTRLQRIIQRARKTVDLCMYSLTHRALTCELTAAKKHGVMCVSSWTLPRRVGLTTASR